MKYTLMNVDYTVRRGEPVIKLFARDENGKGESFTKAGFVPYFYVRKGEGLLHGLAEHGEYVGVHGEDLVKIKMTLPREVGERRKDFEQTWEADIDFPIRFLIDRGLYSTFDIIDGVITPVEDDGKIRRKRVYIDIETENEGGEFPDQREAKMMILTIVMIMYDPNVDVEQEMEFGGITLKVRGEVVCKRYKATCLEGEKEMLENWCNDVLVFDPDDICGSNVHFDMCTIYGRSQYHKVMINAISPMGYVTTRDRYVHEAGKQQLITKVLGRSVVDLTNFRGIPNCFASYFGNKKFESYKLKDLAAGDPVDTDYGLGWPDPVFDYRSMNREHPDFDIDKIVEHCWSDVMKTFGIDMKLNLVDHFDGIRRIAGTVMNKSLMVSGFMDTLMLRMYSGYLICPSKVYGRAGEGKFEGAEVVKPNKGFFKNVDLLDFKQMYIINAIGNNMSNETVCNTVDIPEGREDEYFIVDDVAFKREPVGMFPLALRKMIKLRDLYKGEMKKCDIGTLGYRIWNLRQYSVKQMSAAAYGFSGFKHSRFYDRRIAKSITKIGRKLIKEIIVMAEAESIEELLLSLIKEDVDTFEEDIEQHKGLSELWAEATYMIALYGDTDSAMIMIPEKFDPIVVGKALEARINEHYRKEAEEAGMPLAPKVEFEKVFKTLLFSGKKKRYAGRVIWEEGKTCDKMYIRGFELRSSITAVTSRDIQDRVIVMICYEESKLEIRGVVKEAMEAFSGKPWKEIGIPKTLKRNLVDYGTSQANYLGCWFANIHMGKSFGAGDRALVYWVRGVPEGLPGRIELENKDGKKGYYTVNRIAIDDEEGYERIKLFIDWEVQKEKIIEAKIDKVLDPYGLSMSEIMSGQEQMKGDDYWGGF